METACGACADVPVTAIVLDVYSRARDAGFGGVNMAGAARLLGRHSRVYHASITPLR